MAVKIKSIRKLNRDQVEILTASRDVYVVAEHRRPLVINIDVFDSRIGDPHDAFLEEESDVFENWRDVEEVLKRRYSGEAAEKVRKMLFPSSPGWHGERGRHREAALKGRGNRGCTPGKLSPKRKPRKKKREAGRAKCPGCGSEELRYRKKFDDHACQDCGEINAPML